MIDVLIPAPRIPMAGTPNAPRMRTRFIPMCSTLATTPAKRGVRVSPAAERVAMPVAEAKTTGDAESVHAR